MYITHLPPSVEGAASLALHVVRAERNPKVAAFFIVTTTVKDPDSYQTYVQSVGPTLAPFGGKALLRGKAVAVLAGTMTHQMVGIIEFPDIDKLNAWHASEAYQALIPLRSRAADMTITSYVVPA